MYNCTLCIFGCAASSLLQGLGFGKWGLLFVTVHGLLVGVASLVADQGL